LAPVVDATRGPSSGCSPTSDRRRTGGQRDLRLELVTIPVSDVDRAKAFYVDQAGFTTEQDVQVDDEHRFVELMTPRSPCSIALTRALAFTP
jgi:hypothetical protein